MLKFAKQLNAYSTTDKILVEEEMADQDSGPEAFKKLVKSGKTCDGLVISGHHTGAFGGARTNEELSIDDIEALSCQPELQKWFSNIKSTWLQGCRTLGVGRLRDTDTADFHTDRVGAVLTEDQLRMSFANLNYSFSATLDQENPLSSRYIRAFPVSNMFGWTGTAPGEDARSEYSVPYHIAHVAERITGRYYANPIGKLDSESAIAYMNALVYLLKNENRTKQTCDVTCQAWKDQGNAKLLYAFNNAENNALPPLVLNPNPVLEEAKELECKIKNLTFGPEYIQVVSRILENDSRVAYSFHSISSYMRQLQEEGKVAEYAELKSMMQKSSAMHSFLQRKFLKPELGILLKIDYYTFYRDVMGNSIPSIEGSLRAIALTILARDSEKNPDLYGYQETLLRTIIDNRIFSQDFVARAILLVKDDFQEFILSSIPKGMLDDLNETLFDALFKIEAPAIARTLLEKEWSNVNDTPPAALRARWERLFESNFNLKAQLILFFYLNGKIESIVAYSDYPLRKTIDWYEDLVQQGVSIPATLAKMITRVTNGAFPSESYDDIFSRIQNSRHSNSPLLHQIVNAVLAQNKPDLETLTHIATAMSRSPQKWDDRGSILMKLLKVNNTDREYLCFAVAQTLDELKGDVENFKELVDRIRTSTACEGSARDRAMNLAKTLNVL